MRTKLVFTYNADSGLFNTVADIAHKILSPETYSCQLCALTHGYFSIKEDWVGFLETLEADCEFLHRDELLAKYQLKTTNLPTIYYQTSEGGLAMFMDKETIEACPDLATLKQILQEKLQRLNTP